MKNKAKSETTFFSKLDFFLLGFLIILALILRLYNIDAPVADHHSWRQADTAAVARNYVKSGNFDLLYPKYDDLSSIGTGSINLQGYRFVEFPFYNALYGAIYKYFPLFSLETTGRMVTAIFSLFIIAVLYFLLLFEEGRVAAFFGSLTFSLMPFFVFYSRVILPDMNATSLVFIAIFFLYLFKKTDGKNWFFYIVSLIFAGLSILTKPTVVFYFLSLVYIFYSIYKLSFLKKFSFYFYFIVATIPFFLWRYWISHFPEGIPSSDWLITSVNTYEGLKEIFFRPAFFRWIFYERIANLIMGSYLLVFLLLGIFKKPKNSFLLSTIGLSATLYLFTFQGGNVQHDYYQTIILPALAIFTGVGISAITGDKKTFISPFLSYPIIFGIFVASFLFSYFQVKDFYSYSDNLVKIGKIINTLTDVDSKVVTDTLGDTTLLYLSDRKGFPAKIGDFETLKKQGMQYYVTYNKDSGAEMKKDFELIFENESFYLFKL